VYVPLLTDVMALQLGILAARDVCTKLARCLVGTDAADVLETDEDVLDAVGEVTNMIAGGVKVRLASKHDINVGVPLALRGRVIPSTSSQSMYRLMQMDDSHVWLVMTATRLR
jgi:CheY-specific phosphatase CheX